MEKILFIGGSSFVIHGEWKSGDLFTASSSITAVIEFNTKTPVAPFNCTVSIIAPRNFEIYAAASATATWPKGIHILRLSRSEADFFPNGDPRVEVLEPFQIEVR